VDYTKAEQLVDGVTNEKMDQRITKAASVPNRTLPVAILTHVSLDLK